MATRFVECEFEQPGGVLSRVFVEVRNAQNAKYVRLDLVGEVGNFETVPFAFMTPEMAIEIGHRLMAGDGYERRYNVGSGDEDMYICISSDGDNVVLSMQFITPRYTTSAALELTTALRNEIGTGLIEAGRYQLIQHDVIAWKLATI